MLNHKIPDESFQDALKAAQRYCTFTGRDRVDVMMTMGAVHNHDCPLDFKRLACAKLSDLVHDIGGMEKHVNPRTGKLLNCFFPRFHA